MLLPDSFGVKAYIYTYISINYICICNFMSDSIEVQDIDRKANIEHPLWVKWELGA